MPFEKGEIKDGVGSLGLQRGQQLEAELAERGAGGDVCRA